ncbi:ribonuclease PH [Paenibacillus pini JCM 16418]|uniref:Ribonuclease PH n=1 Tax=Paenibacillus pini JCM 16418 TaxID=1236976 RepID=W7Z6N4_9BACL|nr:ribonuclease PH [Paenibacillus pini JCM 16418]
MALAIAIHKIAQQHKLPVFPITDYLASVSVGVVGGQTLLDLNYEEDSKAKVDMNLVMTGSGAYVELQGTGEESPFTRQELDELLQIGEAGIRDIILKQQEVLGPIGLMIGSGQTAKEV